MILVRNSTPMWNISYITGFRKPNVPICELAYKIKYLLLTKDRKITEDSVLTFYTNYAIYMN